MKKHILAAVATGAALAAAVIGAGVAYAGTPAATTTRPASSSRGGGAYTESGAWATHPASGGTLGQLRLPAGKYVVNAQVVVSVPSTSGRASVACLITCSASARFQGGATVIATTVTAIHHQ